MSSYLQFLIFAAILVLIPGADFTIVVKNTLMGGRLRGAWASVGVSASNVLQGAAAVAGLGAVIVRVEPLFLAVKWAGIGYLLYLAFDSFRSCYQGAYPAQLSAAPDSRAALTGFRQGFLSNITNPKVLVFYLAVLPQFLGPASPPLTLLAYALSHALLSLLYLQLIVALLNRARRFFANRRVRRTLDAATGGILLAFSTRLALEHA
ncbi:LysE family translocator [Dactylosporangium sp. CS-047395]|uniref:LysE family translocator n=1 Tax=Dactylosporangium sp. CS-047395 TaxID=3239936 RepID=UPI003D8D73B0